MRIANPHEQSKKIKDYNFWQDGNEAKELVTNDFMEQKLDYIHNNLETVEIVEEPEHYKNLRNGTTAYLFI